MGKAIIISDLDLSKNNIGQVTPASFNRLQYITSTGTQYIDTGVPVKSGLHVILKMKYTETSTVFGGRDSFAVNSFTFLVNSSELTKPYLNYGNQYIQLNKNQATSGSLIFDFNDNVWEFKSFGNQVLITKTFNKETFTGNSNIYLFGASLPDSVNGFFKGSVYECQIYDGDTLIRDYVAAERYPDLKVGLLDQVNNVFYINKGTGDFVSGPYAE